MQKCQRLHLAGDGWPLLVHKKSLRNTLAVTVVGRNVILVGVGLYTGKDQDILDEDAHITFDRTTDIVKVWRGKEEVGASEDVTDTVASRREARRSDHIPHTTTVCFRRPCVLSTGVAHDIEHRVFPTDVVNHYSGWPVTRLGAELWTCYGENGGATQVETGRHGATFCFAESARGGRSCLAEGQLPLLWFWPI